MEVGDQVRFIHQKLNGKIINKLYGGSFKVELEDGFVIDAFQSELIVVKKENLLDDLKISNKLINEVRENDVKQIKQNKSIKKPLVFDLHIEKLTNSFKTLSNIQILNIQLAHLELNIKTAIRLKEKEIIIIHGIGKGVLRSQVHRVLKITIEVKSFSLTNDRGATKVNLAY